MLPNDLHRQEVPAIVHIVLSEVARLRGEGILSEADFEKKLSRIEREELTSRGLTLSRWEFPGGRMRFQITAAASGDVFDTIEYQPGTPHGMA